MSAAPAVSLKADPQPVRVDGLVHRFPGFQALRDVGIVFPAGEFTTLLGPSGSGKTTLLRIIAGLLRPTQGSVYIGEKDVTRVRPNKRGIGFVFQHYALFPHMTVFENVAYPLRLRKVQRDEIVERVGRALSLVGLRGLDRRHPVELSGGQQQRVALARAIIFNPPVLLMDEPLGSLDKRLRRQLQVELRHLQQGLGTTTIYVTHDQEEAFNMSDLIVVMQEGEVRQVGSPVDVYRHPRDAFVADFVGELNQFAGEVVALDGSDTTVRTDGGLLIGVSASGWATGVRCQVGIRPESIKVSGSAGNSNENSCRGRVDFVTFAGHRLYAAITLQTGERVHTEMDPEEMRLSAGDDVWVSWPKDRVLLFESGPRTEGLGS